MDAVEEVEIFRTELSTRMRMVRKASDATQLQAAETCGISARTYKDYELGRRSPPAEVLMRFCRSFQVNPDKLIFGNEGLGVVQARGRSDDFDDIAAGLLAVFGQATDDDAIARQVKLARYARESARAKGRSFEEELRELNGLTS